ncbi:hypothetical protein E2C01_050011 [Portunus trituberculatus]|uniref:Uncharacterized protein n=1 Tax=Portunus trituberculatus TaxID=210409 RepID=A0A5B7G748_PORTR|nr:hypothetical protein [Portunus trituberculatus]
MEGGTCHVTCGACRQAPGGYLGADENPSCCLEGGGSLGAGGASGGKGATTGRPVTTPLCLAPPRTGDAACQILSCEVDHTFLRRPRKAPDSAQPRRQITYAALPGGLWRPRSHIAECPPSMLAIS